MLLQPMKHQVGLLPLQDPRPILDLGYGTLLQQNRLYHLIFVNWVRLAQTTRRLPGPCICRVVSITACQLST